MNQQDQARRAATIEHLDALAACRDAFEDELLTVIIETGSPHAADDVARRIDRVNARLLAAYTDAYFTGEINGCDEAPTAEDEAALASDLLPF